MGSIFSFIIIIVASLIGGFFMNEMFQYISFFGMTPKQQFIKALNAAQKRRAVQNDQSAMSTVTNPEIKD